MNRIATITCLAMAFLASACGGKTSSAQSEADTIALAPCPAFQADSALAHIVAQCQFGPRITGSRAADSCAVYLKNAFARYGAKVSEQMEEVTLWDGKKLMARNIIASINTDNTDRVLLCAHWDSRPWADNDPDEENHRKPVLGANDGASGVAVMLEICRLIQSMPVETGIDFVCFDAEDLGTPQWAVNEVEHDNETWCLGSAVWAEKARDEGYKARYGILLDMVGGRGSTFAREQVSMLYARPVVDLIWQLAHQLGYSHFFPMKDGGYLMDDHVNVNEIAQVPCLDIVPYFEGAPSSFGPTWHTVLDTPKYIDPHVLEAVGQTLTQLLYNDNAEQ